MKHHSRNVAVAAFAVCTFIYACGQESNVGSRFVKSEQVAASKGAAISVSAAEEPELAGSALDIPAGALGGDTTITLELGLKAITESPRGPVAIWGPSGTVFSKPARMTLPLALLSSAELAQVEILVEESDGRRFSIPRSELMIDAAAKSVTFSVNGFTRFQPTVRPVDGGTTGTGAGARGAAARRVERRRRVVRVVGARRARAPACVTATSVKSARCRTRARSACVRRVGCSVVARRARVVVARRVAAAPVVRRCSVEARPVAPAPTRPSALRTRPASFARRAPSVSAFRRRAVVARRAPVAETPARAAAQRSRAARCSTASRR